MHEAGLLRASPEGRHGFRLYLTSRAEIAGADAPTLLLPEALTHLEHGDVIAIAPNGRLAVLWKASAKHNSLLLTEQCDNYCIMCSQPPKIGDDGWLFDRAEKVIRLLPPTTPQVGLSGGEPTLHEERLLSLLDCLHAALPKTQVHLLSNGRKFADAAFTQRYAAVRHTGLMVGIPLYAPESGLHDYIVQSEGAFDETVRGILALAGHRQRIELRIVIQAANVDVLPRLAEFIARNLPFVEQVALMGLEMTGFARANADRTWVDPADYQDELRSAATRLRDTPMKTLIFNHPVCVLHPTLRPLAVPSISD